MKNHGLLFVIGMFCFVPALFCSASITRDERMQKACTLEWHEITEGSLPGLMPTFESLQDIFVAAFLPVTRIDMEKQIQLSPGTITVPVSDEGICHALKNLWQAKLLDLQQAFQSEAPQHNRIASAYLVIAKNNQNQNMGFALFTSQRLGDILQGAIFNVCKPIESFLIQDTAYLDLVAVNPAMQGCGLGRALVFSVFDHCPFIKNIYLIIPASSSNESIQKFYEHLKFFRYLQGDFWGNLEDSPFDKEKIMYLYQKP